ncbi:sensor histidine kinase [Methylobacterium oryzihabitans]|uniref:histidine kinase n=1 Tax=Methylobacterium oryzihabitans TaxID=2499852 RepID=A0A3S2YN15_9HYPH|nr:sensor histidine kinase [Methylobacterium oryzihabitans]RVU15294.1 HAMP domain-containing protein [Methylobacterium oryzihabitans]
MPPPPLRVFLALGLGAAGLLATLVLALVASRAASERLEARIEGELGDFARQMAHQLDRSMFERWRDMRILAENDTIRDPAADLSHKRRVLRRAQETYPDYAILGLISPEGRVLVTSSGVLEGLDVSHRDYVVRGREGPVAIDVHDARLLATLQPDRDSSDPPRVLDLAAPVHAAEGGLAGIVVAHLDWAWARDVESGFRRETTRDRPGIDVMVLARDGTVLLGPPDLKGTVPGAAEPPGEAARRAGAATERWPDGNTYLVGLHPTRGYRDYPGLGWSVMVRQDAERAFAPVTALRRQILLWGVAVAAVSGLIGWYAAGLLARPLRRLAVAAAALAQGGRVRPPETAVRETQAIGQALAAAADSLGRQAEERRQADERQQLLIHELNHRVKNTLATVQSMARQTARGAGSLDAFIASFEARLLAMSQTHNVLTANHWQSVGLAALLAAELEPYAGTVPERVVLEGEAVALPPAVAVPLGMVAHELATNAAKYGALSVPEGRVAVRWGVEDGRLALRWSETGGPPVAPPARAGFGTRLIRASIERELAGTAALDYAPGGFVCTVTVPLAPREVPIEPVAQAQDAA